jgi:hypothetical protein
MALRSFPSRFDQFEKFNALRALFAPNKYDGASFAFQGPLA